MKMDKGKLINRVSDRIFHSNLKPFWKRCVATKMCYTSQTYWYRYRYLVSLKIVGIVSVSYRFKKAGIAHPYHKPRASCFNVLQRVCKYQGASSLIFANAIS